MKPAAVFDFHGTLVDVTSIHDMLAEGDFEGFYTASLECPPIADTVEAAHRSHRVEHSNLLLTGMTENHFDGLNTWLVRHSVPIDYIAMRRVGDRRMSFVVKREMYHEVVNRGYYVVRAWEDNPRDVDFWNSQAIPVTVVPGWSVRTIVRQVDKNSG